MPVEEAVLANQRYKMMVENDKERARIDKYLPREQVVLEAFADELSKNDVVWDVGANTGAYTLVAASYGAFVESFEPVLANCKRLHENLYLNQLWSSVSQLALSNRNGSTTIGVNGKSINVAGEGLNSIGNGDMTVPMRRADDHHMIPDVVKIDVEGSEGRVLEGFGRTLSDVRTVFVEIHGEADYRTSVTDYDYTTDRIIQMLDNAGFMVDVIDESKNEQFVRGT